jgi:hypothetical protein
MNKLIITAGMIAFALCGSQAHAGAGQPTRWFPPQLTWKEDHPSAETGNGQQTKPSYKSYRDRLGHGSVQQNFEKKKQLRDLEKHYD